MYMCLGNNTIPWHEQCKYIGITFNFGPKVTVDINVIREKFFVACNSIFGKSQSLDELITIIITRNILLAAFAVFSFCCQISFLSVLEHGFLMLF